MSIYLDWAATALHDEEILRAALNRAMLAQGNPSSRHEMGFKARSILEEDRERCAQVLGCQADKLFFTSGGTESNNLVLLSHLHDRTPGRIIISSLEHPSLSEPSELLNKSGAELKILKSDKRGIITPETLKKHLTKETRLVSIMAVHNESGVIQPLGELIKTVRDFQKKEGGRPIHFHSDMVQAAGKISFNLKELDLDSASFSAHKIRGPKGSGLLYLKKELTSLYRGGGQEKGIRSGTESIQNSSAMAFCLEKWASPSQKKNPVYESFLNDLKSLKSIIFNPPARITEPHLFVPQIINLSLPPLPGEVLQRVLNEKGFCISTGSACSSRKKSNTQGLLSMGISEKTAHCSVRVSLGPETTGKEKDKFISCLKDIMGEYVF